jgi:hypothetical protein
MRLIVSIITWALVGYSLQAQDRLLLKFVDAQQKPLSGVTVINYLQQEFGPSDAKGLVVLPANAGTVVQAFKEGYFIKLLELDWSKVTSTAVPITLEVNDQQLELITVRGKQRLFTDTLRVRAFDFQDSLLLVLGYRHIVLANTSLKAKWSIPNTMGYINLVRDPRGNLFLLSEDSVSQVLLRKNQVYFYPAASIGDYHQYIEPLAAVIGESLILRDNRPQEIPLPVSPFRPGSRGKSMTIAPFHNQGVQFLKYQQGQKAQEFYYSQDAEAIEYAHSAFMDAFAIAATMERFFDQFGYYKPGVIFELSLAQRIYQNGYARYLPTPIHKVSEDYWLFDRFKDSVIVFNKEGQRTRQYSFNIDKTFCSPLVLQDYKTQQLYALKVKRKVVYLHKLNHLTLASGIRVDLFAKKTKVFNNVLYFINESNYLVRKNL